MLPVVFAVAVGASLSAASPSHAAKSVTKAYAAGGTPVLPAMFTAGSGTPGIGGNVFSKRDEPPTLATVRDASGGPVKFLVCQDLDDDYVCGNQNPGTGETEPRVIACGNEADLTTSEVPFVASEATRVFVAVGDWACRSVSLGGTITLQYDS